MVSRFASHDCKTCVVEACSEIRKRCPYNKGGIIWYDHCLFKYSNVEFFSQVDYGNRFYMWKSNKVSEPEAFNQKTKQLLSEMANEAYANPKLYAVGETELYGSEKLYRLTQCTRDLSTNECKKCLDGIIGELPSCCIFFIQIINLPQQSMDQDSNHTDQGRRQDIADGINQQQEHRSKPPARSSIVWLKTTKGSSRRKYRNNQRDIMIHDNKDYEGDGVQ